MTTNTDDREPDDSLEDDEYDDGYDADCYRCSGNGWRECDDPIQCTRPHNQCGECQCPSCGGSGLAKDMTIW